MVENGRYYFGLALLPTQEQAEEWIQKLRERDPFYETHIGKALEERDEAAMKFVRMAIEIDPTIFETTLKGFQHLVNEIKASGD